MPSSDLVQALSRGLMLLELLANSEGGMTLQQLCQELELKPATVHNLLRTLMARSYVEKLSKPTRYTLGVSLFELVEQHRGRDLQRRVGKAMSTIFNRFNFARVTYSEAIGGEVFLKLRITPERPGLLERPLEFGHAALHQCLRAVVPGLLAYGPAPDIQPALPL